MKKTTKLKMLAIWNILRGRPTIYAVQFVGHGPKVVNFRHEPLMIGTSFVEFVSGNIFLQNSYGPRSEFDLKDDAPIT